MSNSYQVKWVLDIEDAESPRDAAQQAWEHMQDKGSIANYFTVTNDSSEISVDVDLEQEEETYSPDCFDGRFFKWDDFVLATICDKGSNIYELSHKGKRIKLFYFLTDGYENDQEAFLNDVLEGVKQWIARNNIK